MRLDDNVSRPNLEIDREDFVSPAQLRAQQAQQAAEAAQQAALAQAGVTDASTFGPTASTAPVAGDAGPASDGPTMTAAQLANGAANVATSLAAETPKYAPPSDPSNLSEILSGADGQPSLTRQQVADTVVAAMPAAQQPAVQAFIAKGVTDASLASAFSQVVTASETPGQKPLSLELVGEHAAFRGIKAPDQAPTVFTGTMSVAADGTVNGKTLPSDAAVAAAKAPYPDGNSADSIKTKYTPAAAPGDLDGLLAAHDGQPALSREAVVDTVLAAVPEAKGLIDAGVTNDSLARAFSQVIDARNSPGQKPLSLDLVGLQSQTTTVGSGEDQSTVTQLVPADKPTTFTTTLSVSADGKVNGAELPVDQDVRITTTLARVEPEYKDATLREVGLSEEWLQNAPQAQKDYALSQIVAAQGNPGTTKTLDLSYPYSFVQSSGEDTHTVDTTAAGHLTLNVGADGSINGKTPTIDSAYSATCTIEAMSTAERKATLKALGFGAEPIANASSDQVRSVLVKASMQTASPGDKQFQVEMGGKKYAVGMKVGDKGQILGAGTAEVPPPPKKSWWKQAVSVVCTVVSVVFPVAAPVCMGINAAIAISNGAKGLALVGAIAGAAAGVGDLAGLADVASTMSTVSNVANGVNSAINAARSGDYLGALSGALGAGAGLGGSFGDALGSAASLARGASGVVNAVKTGDLMGLVSAGVSTAGALGLQLDPELTKTIGTIGTVVNTAHAISSGNVAGALTGILSLTGTGGAAPATPTTGPVATQADVRAVDNAIDAASQTVSTVTDTARSLASGDDAAALAGLTSLTTTDAPPATEDGPLPSQSQVRAVDNELRATQRTPAEVRQDFDLAFSGARANGQSTFLFDKGDGRGPQPYATGTREEVAAAIPGGSTRDYQSFVKSSFNGVDSAAALSAYRASKLTPVSSGVNPLDLVGTVPFDTAAFVGSDGTDLGLPSATAPKVNNLTVSNGPATPATPWRANTGNDFLDSVVDRVATIGRNVGTVASGTGGDQLLSGAKSLYNSAVDATARGIGYVADTSLSGMASDAATLGSKAVNAIKNDPAGAAWTAFNTVVPVGEIYEGVKRLGDEDLSYSEAAANVTRATVGVLGTVTLGLGGAGATATKVVDETVARTALDDAAQGAAREALLDPGASAAGGQASTLAGGGTIGPRSSTAPLTTSTNAADRVADISQAIADYRASGQTLAKDLHESFQGARNGADSFVIDPGLKGNGSARMVNGQLEVKVNPNLVEYTPLADGLEVVGYDTKAAATLNHEVLGHGGDYLAMQQDGTLPYLLRVGADSRLPGGYAAKGAAFTETTGWVESATAMRSVFLDASAHGDLAGAAVAAKSMGERLDGLLQFGQTFLGTTNAAMTPESMAAIRGSVAPIRDASGAVLAGSSAELVPVQFKIIENGQEKWMMTQVPRTAATSQAAVSDVINAQFANGLTELKSVAGTYQSLLNDAHAMQQYLVSKTPRPGPVIRPGKPGIIDP